MEQLSPLDAAFLEAEDTDRHASLAIASVAVIEGPPPSQKDYVATIGARLRAIPRARQKVRRVPWDLGPPVWVDDPGFDLGYHLRRTALPAPGDDAALNRLVGRIMSQRLDRDRPLWESWVIEGLAGGRWAVLTKLHHCLADGVSGAQLYGVLFSGSPEPDPEIPYQVPELVPPPSMVSLLADALADFVRFPVEQLRLLVGAARSPRRLMQGLTGTARDLAALAGRLWPAGPSSLSGSIGAQRRYGIARASLPDVVAIGKAHGATVNDVALTAISGAFRALLLHRGEVPDTHTLRTLVPVSVRAKGDHDILDNRVSLVLPFLPVDIADPVEALAVVHSRLCEAKADGEAQAGQAVTELAAHEPFGPVSWMIRLVTRLPQHSIITVTTNVPGPREPLYVLGRKVVELQPYVPIALRLRIGVAVMTYCDQMVFGITADYDSTSELELLTGAIESGIAELSATSRPRRAKAKQR
ncbi:MAG TPA: wax ester/triacylglycerol synthase family O-acyltransferase [Actinophytocola sp.]|uniref:WS/DGAT/MGAT family O-acyltransferase n=1 Tax=Actinophytocola sp. TaxID=1872138 RepID=UPI002DB97A2B|nr:wax ester/triacylglycerol synthase family O-acyltransferase [Actinophytocola sp.]HEU5469332.1 wax ester/triacylglycerol synthase family O-acyltransferase [Actinophytocola sp.]